MLLRSINDFAARVERVTSLNVIVSKISNRSSDTAMVRAVVSSLARSQRATEYS